MIEYDHEPVRGLPGDLPKGEHILWQGAPDWRTFLRTALYSRWVLGYFALLGLWALASGSMGGMVASVIAAAVTIGLLAVFAVLVARTTVYTLTDARLVLRIGVALNKCINLPLAKIGSAQLREHAGGHGDIALLLTGRHGLGYAMLWPHARPLRLSAVQPMLRAVPDAQNVAKMLGEACNAVVPNVAGESESAASAPSLPAGLEEATA